LEDMATDDQQNAFDQSSSEPQSDDKNAFNESSSEPQSDEEFSGKVGENVGAGDLLSVLASHNQLSEQDMVAGEPDEEFSGEVGENSGEGDLLSALESHSQLSEQDMFAGEDDFYELLEESDQDTSAGQFVEQRRFSSVQKVLVISIVAVVLLIVYELLKRPLAPTADRSSTSANKAAPNVRQTPVSRPAVTEPVQVVQDQVREPEPVPPLTRSLSLKVARDFYLQKNYKEAYAAYDQLRRAMPTNEEMLRDFLQLRMAVCSKQVADFEQASRLLMAISQSRSPAVQTVANYHLCLLEIQRKRYLRARTRAYNTIALIKAVDFDNDWALSFECDCHFLAAECLTRHILSLTNTDSDLPDDLWSNPTAFLDPFGSLNEAELRGVLNSGSEYLGRGLLDPKIRRIEHQSGPPRWSVISYGAPVEELMAKFAAGAEVDVHWALEAAASPNSREDAIRQRLVRLYLPAATSQQVVLIAAGCAGLLARPENDPGTQKVTIFDPTEYSSLREQISFLSQQAISLWQKFVLTFYSDKRLANVHFVMGLLQSQIGLPTEAIAEYKLVANRFSQMQLASFALLQSSKVKASLRDYHGAREDLTQLVEQYHDSDIYGQAYLSLAHATMEAGLYPDAALLYRRVYNFGLSRESKTASAIGAAGCFYKTKSYEDTVEWLTRYINLAGEDENNNLYSAYFLLGQTNLALGQYQQACDAFRYALVEQNSRQQYIEAIVALAKGHIEQGHLVEALETLENASSVALSQEQSVEILLLKSRIYRLLGLTDTAIVFLRDRAEYVSDSQLSAKISFDLAQCHIAKGNLQDARSVLSEMLAVVEPGLLAQRTALELAEVCIKLGRSSQAVSVCLQLLDLDVSAQTKQKTLRTLAAAYSQEKDYDKAVLALSGQWK
jgi:tetratricopeptide (TPR) repeat protein